ncbi:MAG: lysylphosphatidylglycerol synthase transmembrane domain-containing protein [Flavobacteriaceae bacterium]|nr:lysylphosphatidylglycerol synthase transmembrane domain-containing protein [Flavobacteriaceae bacterium]
MNPKAKTGVTVLVSILLAVALIWWAMRGLDLEKTRASLQEANYLWIAISVILGIAAYYLRSERWRLLLDAMDHPTKSSHAFYAICMNYFWNLLIPRSGEIARCTTLYTLNKTPVEKSFGTVISERVIDLICLVIIALLAVLFNFNLILQLFGKVMSVRSEQEEGNYFFVVIIGALLIFLAGCILFWKKLKNLSFFPRIKQFLYGIRQGLISIFRLKKSGLFIFYTFLIWVFYFFMTYVIIFALPETAHLTLSEGLYLLLVGSIGMVIPASGGIGAFHSAMRLGFEVLGLGGDVGVNFAFLVHTPHALIALVLGLICLSFIYSEKRKKRK